MSEPIVEQIAVDLVTVLETVTTANGYHYSLADVKRPTAGNDDGPGHLVAVLTQDDPDEDEELSHPGNPAADAWEQPFEVEIFVSTSEDAAEAIDTVLNRLAADCAKAIMADPQRSELALDTRMLPPRYYRSIDGGYEIVTVRPAVRYRTDEDDPYTAR